MNTPTLRGAVLGGLTAAVGFGIFAMWAPATASADTVLMVGGADIQAFPGAENGVYMPAILGGALCKGGSGNQCLVVPFSGAAGVLTPNNPQPLDASVAAAADRLVQQIRQTPGKKIAVGYSAGAPVVEEAAQRLTTDPNGPPPDQLSVITVGNINDGLAQIVPPGTYLTSIGYTVRPTAQTKYPTTVVTDSKDLANSAPNFIANPLEALSGISDTAHAHLGYFSPDIDFANPAYRVSQDGNVSHVVLPGPNGAPPVAQSVSDTGQHPMADANTNPGADVNHAYPVPPELVDQFIGATAPSFASAVNGDKDTLVQQLWPVISEHPEMFNDVPLFGAPTAPQTNDQTVQGAGVTPSP